MSALHRPATTAAELKPGLRPVKAATRRAAKSIPVPDLRPDPTADRDPDSMPANTTQRIADSITAAIVERRLMPGTKLAEQKIADVFKVSRTLVRQALNQLSRDKLITLERSRGARVAEPSLEDARQVFEVRMMIESAMARRAVATFTDDHIRQLRDHLRQEQDAVQRADVSGRTHLLADFHVLMARLLGNDVLAGMVQDLASRSSLIALMYQSAHSAEHSFEEHVAIVDAIERRDARAAVKLMEDHLRNVETNTRLHPRLHDMHAALLPSRSTRLSKPLAKPASKSSTTSHPSRRTQGSVP